MAAVVTNPGPALINELIAAVLEAGPRLGAVRLVTIDGPSGSGKSTLAGDLTAGFAARGVNTVLVRTDHFATWREPFTWWDRLEAGVLQPLATGREGSYLANDWSGTEPVPRLGITVPVPDVLIVEGVSANRRAIGDRSVLTVWVEHPNPEQRLERAVGRDGEQIRPWLIQWQRDEEQWFAADGSRGRADVVVSVS